MFRIVAEDASCMQNWRKLLRTLSGMKENDLVAISLAWGRDGPEECLYQGLLRWQQVAGSRAKLDALLKGLDICKLNFVKGESLR